jgi:hypothetical protein
MPRSLLPRIAVATMVVAAVCVFGVSAGTAKSRSARAPITTPAAGLLFGASIATAAGQTAAQSFAALESQVGRTLAMDRSYSRWDDQQPVPIVVDDAAHGRVPLLSIKAQRRDGSIISWASIAAGDHDAEIRAQADALRDSQITLILSFHHEPEFSPGYGSPADYVAAFRHYVAVFRGEGAANVQFAVILGASTYANPSAWYPGDDVVDWLGADAYNFAACAAGLPAWRTLATAAAAFYAWGSAHGKPLVLAEWGSAEDPSQPGRKAQWLQDAAVTLAGWPNVKAATYFDRVGSCDWRIDTSPSAAAAFVDISHAAWANGSPTGRLLASAAIGAAPLDEAFDLSTSTGAGSATGTGVSTWSLDFGDGSAPATGVGQPTTVAHTYNPGHWTAQLTVGDATGNQAAVTTLVIAAGAPTISEGNATAVTSSTASLPGWVYTSAIAGKAHVEWGTSTSYGSRTPTVTLPALDYTQAVTTGLAGLAHATRYYWRLVATTAAGTTHGPARWFTTGP